MFFSRDSNKSFKLDVDLSETMTNYVLYVDHCNQQDQIIIYEFGKEMKIEIRQKGRKSNRDKTVIKMPKSPAVMASGISTKILRSDPNELYDKMKLLLQKDKLEVIQT